MSVISISGCNPWMTYTDGRVIRGWHKWMKESSRDDTLPWGWNFSIHGWHFFIHEWHPRMTLLHPWMTFLHPWMTSKDGTSIHGWGFSIHGWHPRMALSFMDEVSPSMDGIFICQIFCENCHRNWLLFCKIDTKWMKTIDDGHGRSINDIFCPKVLARLS